MFSFLNSFFYHIFIIVKYFISLNIDIFEFKYFRF